MDLRRSNADLNWDHKLQRVVYTGSCFRGVVRWGGYHLRERINRHKRYIDFSVDKDVAILFKVYDPDALELER